MDSADGLAEALRRRLKTPKELTGILYDRSYNGKTPAFMRFSGMFWPASRAGA